MELKNFVCIVFLITFIVKNRRSYNVSAYTFQNKIQQNENIITNLLMKELDGTKNATAIMARMLDASTKNPSGILDGHFYDLGCFDECYNLHVDNIYGKYCLGELKIPIDPTISSSYNQIDERYQFALCIPNTLDIKNISGNISYENKYCYSKDTEPKVSTGAIITLVIIGTFAMVCAVATVLDIICFYQKKDLGNYVLRAFSYLSNCRKLMKSSSNPNELLCLHGIKSLSTMWVFLFHEVTRNLCIDLFPNAKEISRYEKTSPFHFNMGLCVDTFFLLGGLTSVYSFFNSIDKGASFNIFVHLIHRYLRLTPIFAIFILMHAHLVEHMGSGPRWEQVNELLVRPCRENWLYSVLYITNYFNPGLECVSQAWYLSVDMQCFVIASCFIFTLVRFPKLGLTLLGILLLAGIAVPFNLAYVGNIGPWFTGYHLEHFYTQTYTRFGPYVVGIILAYIIHATKKSGKNIYMLSLVQALVLWIVSLALMTLCSLASHSLMFRTDVERLKWSLFLALHRTIWSIAISVIIYLCFFEYGGPINKFLSLPIFQQFSKVSYSIYLTHYAIIVMRYSSLRNGYTFNNYYLFNEVCGDFMLSLIVSIGLYLTIECPFAILENKYIGMLRKKINH